MYKYRLGVFWGVDNFMKKVLAFLLHYCYYTYVVMMHSIRKDTTTMKVTIKKLTTLTDNIYIYDPIKRVGKVIFF